MPAIRLRRLRKNSQIRDWIGQTELSPRQIILPYFVVGGRRIKEAIKSLPGVYRFSIDNLLKDLARVKKIKSLLLFGIPEEKDELGSHASRPDGVVQNAVRAIKKKYREVIIITDVCLCAYTTPGHCGLVKGREIDNDATLARLAEIAISHARAGADFVAPSSMMDGQVGVIRKALDLNGFENVGILAYSAKYASNFYGPFREALNSAPKFGDRKTYQMDCRNSDEALRAIQRDIEAGADIVMIKPALAYLDIIYRAKQKFNVPLAAYNVSGEYALVKKLSAGNRKTEKNMALEILTAIKRAGADLIISYFGREVGQWLE